MEWLRGRWNWPPLESDPELFEELMLELIGRGRRNAPDGTTEELRAEGRTCDLTPAQMPRIEEVFGLDDESARDIHGARALLVCFRNRGPAFGDSPPALAATDAIQAQPAADEEVRFIKQIPTLDAACGIIALVHALLNTEALFASSGLPALGGCLREWFDGLPSDATPLQRGRSLAADERIRSVYKHYASRGQSRMPLSPLLMLFGPLLLVPYLLCRRCGVRRPPILDCHFVCIAAGVGGRVLLLDGSQGAAKDIGAYVEDGRDASCPTFTQCALGFVRETLLSKLERPNACSIMAIFPSLASR